MGNLTFMCTQIWVGARAERTKEKGSIGELRAMYEAALRGYGVLIPHGDFCEVRFGC